MMMMAMAMMMMNYDVCIQMNSPPPAYSTSSLSRGYHSVSPPTADRQTSTPPSVTPTARSRGRYSSPATMTLPLRSWETFHDNDTPHQPSPSSGNVARLSPLTTDATDIVKEKPADTDSPVSPKDVSFYHN